MLIFIIFNAGHFWYWVRDMSVARGGQRYNTYVRTQDLVCENFVSAENSRNTSNL